MSKKRREEEAKILAEMEEAMKEKAEKEPTENDNAQKPKTKIFGVFEDKTPQKLHCQKCQTLMENGVCPNCGHSIYVPMDSEKQKKIRWIATVICVVVFLILFIWLEVTK